MATNMSLMTDTGWSFKYFFQKLGNFFCPDRKIPINMSYFLGVDIHLDW